MDRRTLLIAGAVFAACFVVVLAGPSLLDRLAKLKPVQSDAEVALDAGQLDHDEDLYRAVRQMRRDGLHPTLAELNAARDDVPENPTYAAYAEVEKPPYIAINVSGENTGPLDALCYGFRVNGKSQHGIAYYNRDVFHEGAQVPLYQWIKSGCATAVAARERSETRTQLYQRLRRLVPRTPRFDIERQTLGGDIYEVCEDEVRARYHDDGEYARHARQCQDLVDRP